MTFHLGQQPALFTSTGKALLLFAPAGENGRTEPWLAGVYAGRVGVTGQEIEMALGRVWHRRLRD